MKFFAGLARLASSASVAVSLALAPTAPLTAAQSPAAVAFWLTILHNNDAESDLLSAGAGERADFGGAARFKTVLERLRREAVSTTDTHGRGATPRGVIVVSSGDNFLAGPEFDASLSRGKPYFDTVAMDLIGYDAVAIGNHDFDFGPEVLADFIEGYQRTAPPYLGANLDHRAEPRLQALVERGRIARSVVIEQAGRRIGIIGALTPNLRFISSPRRVAVDVDVAGAVRGEVRHLEQSGVDQIILISHLQEIEADLALAAQLHGVDVMVAGGGDEALANAGDLLLPGDRRYGPYPMMARAADGTPVPVVTTAGSYGYVGRLVVGFDAAGRVVEIGPESGPVRVAGGGAADAAAEDPQMRALVSEPVAAFVADLAARTIAQSSVPLDGRKSAVRFRETNQGDLMADALLWQARSLAAAFDLEPPMVAIQNGGGIRNDSIIPAGTLTELDTFKMAPFPNYVAVFDALPRAHFKQILENALSHTQPDDPSGGAGRFPHIAGFHLRWSGSGVAQVTDEDGDVTSPGTRVRDVVLDDGTAIVADGAVIPGAPVSVATIDFLARGGDQYPYRDAPFRILGVSYQQALSRYIREALGGRVTAADYPPGGSDRMEQTR